jgi:hypothetical protein
VNIARERSLRNRESAAAQLAAQLVLVGHQRAGQQVPYRVVPLKLHFIPASIQPHFADKLKARPAVERPRMNKYT